MSAHKAKHSKIFSPKLAKNIIIALIVVWVFDFFLFPMSILASELGENTNISNEIKVVENDPEPDNSKFFNTLPKNNEWEVKWSGYYTVTAYNSLVDQCDSTPCITANGFNLCEHGIEDSIATNFLSFGTKIRIPEFFGEKVFVVRDRMNARYTHRFDIWMLDKGDARQFGAKVAKIEILVE